MPTLAERMKLALAGPPEGQPGLACALLRREASVCQRVGVW